MRESRRPPSFSEVLLSATIAGLLSWYAWQGYHRAPRATESQGVTATLKYEKVADMTVARMSHQFFPSGNGFVVVGGRTTCFQLTRTAELY